MLTQWNANVCTGRRHCLFKYNFTAQESSIKAILLPRTQGTGHVWMSFFNRAYWPKCCFRVIIAVIMVLPRQQLQTCSRRQCGILSASCDSLSFSGGLKGSWAMSASLYILYQEALRKRMPHHLWFIHSVTICHHRHHSSHLCPKGQLWRFSCHVKVWRWGSPVTLLVAKMLSKCENF